MHFPRLPDWLIYTVAVLALLFAALGRRERANAPEAPPPVPGEAGVPLASFLGFDPARVIHVPPMVAPMNGAGTAFSVSDSGVWLTAAHVVRGCRQTAVVVAPGKGVTARALLDPNSDVAILRTVGGSPPLPIGGPQDIKPGDRGYLPGYPQGQTGEVTTLLVGPDHITAPGRDAKPEPVTAWTETGRTEGLKGLLNGLSGAPVLDDAGQVVGVALGQAPRRGRIFAAPPQAVLAALARAGVSPSPSATGQPINIENYGRVADTLRRDLRVAQVMCLR